MKWMCKYHIIFTPKYRRKIVYNQYKVDLRDILKQLCSYKGGSFLYFAQDSVILRFCVFFTYAVIFIQGIGCAVISQ